MWQMLYYIVPRSCTLYCIVTMMLLYILTYVCPFSSCYSYVCCYCGGCNCTDGVSGAICIHFPIDSVSGHPCYLYHSLLNMNYFVKMNRPLVDFTPATSETTGTLCRKLKTSNLRKGSLSPHMLSRHCLHLCQ